EFRIRPILHSSGPRLDDMLAMADAALLIGDNALFLDNESQPGGHSLEKIDLGEVWTRMTGLPFVYAFWAGRPDVLTADDVAALQQARDDGIGRIADIAAGWFKDPRQHAICHRYLRDNITSGLGTAQPAG